MLLRPPLRRQVDIRQSHARKLMPDQPLGTGTVGAAVLRVVRPDNSGLGAVPAASSCYPLQPAGECRSDPSGEPVNSREHGSESVTIKREMADSIGVAYG